MSHEQDKDAMEDIKNPAQESEVSPEPEEKRVPGLPRSKKKALKRELREQKRKQDKLQNQSPDEENDSDDDDDEDNNDPSSTELAKNKHQERRKRLRQKRSEELQTFLKTNFQTDAERDAYMQQEREAKKQKLDELERFLDASYKQGRPRIVINCSFSEAMSFKEQVSLKKQVELTYNVLKEQHVVDSSNSGGRPETGFQLHLSSFIPSTSAEFNPPVSTAVPTAAAAAAPSTDNKSSTDKDNKSTPQPASFPLHPSWRIHTHKEPYWEVNWRSMDNTNSNITSSNNITDKPPQLVILSPDAREVLDEVDPNLTYVIGGSVDRMVVRGQTLDQSLREDVQPHILRRVRLPLRECAAPGTTKVLNIDTVIKMLMMRCRRPNSTSSAGADQSTVATGSATNTTCSSSKNSTAVPVEDAQKLIAVLNEEKEHKNRRKEKPVEMKPESKAIWNEICEVCLPTRYVGQGMPGGKTQDKDLKK